MYMPSMIIRAGDEAIFSPNMAQVWPEAHGNPWGFHGFWVARCVGPPKAGENPSRQAGRRGSPGQPARRTPNHARTAAHIFLPDIHLECYQRHFPWISGNKNDLNGQKRGQISNQSVLK
jgi:hypothetical protein